MFVGKIFERVQPPIWGVERNFKAPILFANILNSAGEIRIFARQIIIWAGQIPFL
jgi:hypothetical protein